MTVTLEDAGKHRPDSADPRWQESFYLGWHDALNRLAGAHHISLNPNGGSAHVWSWLSVEGQVVGRRQEHALAYPRDDFFDLKLGSLGLVTRSLRDMTLTAEFDHAQVRLDYAAFCDPVSFSLDGDGVALGGHHYETTGRVRGVVSVGGREIAVNAGTWQDHSWGLRAFSSIPSSRFFYAVFGEDLAMSSHLLVSPEGAIRTYGWTFERGQVRRVTQYLVPAVVAQDGISPISCDIRIRTDDGGGFRLSGQVDSNVLMGGADWTEGDWFGMDGLTHFECGGRLGEGILEVCELKALSPAQRASLKLK